MEYILLIIGFVLIIKSSDVLVDAASSLAAKWHVPKMVIALTIVAFGTCAPELAISFQSIGSGNGSMALANVIGSCIVNVLLIVGLASFIQPIQIKNQTVKKEMPILLLATIGLIVLIMDRLFFSKTNMLNRPDGLMLILLFMLFVYYIVSVIRKKKENQEEELVKYGLIKSFIYLILSIIVIVISSDLIVENAEIIAKSWGISQKVITLVVIVIGTSLPELVMTVTAAKKNEFEIAIGNIIGTNIFNICVVLGLPITLLGKLYIVDFNMIDLIFVFLSSALLFLFARSERKISKVEGALMIIIFLCYYAYALFM